VPFVNTGNTSIKDLSLLQNIHICSWTFVHLVVVVKLPAVEARLHLVPRLRMSGLTPPLPHNNWWCVQRHLLLLLPVVNYYSLLFVIRRETVATVLPV